MFSLCWGGECMPRRTCVRESSADPVNTQGEPVGASVAWHASARRNSCRADMHFGRPLEDSGAMPLIWRRCSVLVETHEEIVYAKTSVGR